MAADTTVVVQPTTTSVVVQEQNGPVGVVQATVQTIEVQTQESVEIVEVGVQGPAGSEEDMPFARRTDFVNETLIYRGEALPGASETGAVWRVRRLSIAGDDDVTEEWADGNSNFDNIWANRDSLSYS